MDDKIKQNDARQNCASGPTHDSADQRSLRPDGDETGEHVRDGTGTGVPSNGIRKPSSIENAGGDEPWIARWRRRLRRGL